VRFPFLRITDTAFSRLQEALEARAFPDMCGSLALGCPQACDRLKPFARPRAIRRRYSFAM
jgi:hypothetical protein